MRFRFSYIIPLDIVLPAPFGGPNLQVSTLLSEQLVHITQRRHSFAGHAPNASVVNRKLTDREDQDDQRSAAVVLEEPLRRLRQSRVCVWMGCSLCEHFPDISHPQDHIQANVAWGSNQFCVRPNSEGGPHIPLQRWVLIIPRIVVRFWTCRYFTPGLVPPLAQKTISLSLMFGVYEGTRKPLVEQLNLNPYSAKMLAGIVAGSVETVLMPFERVQTLLADSAYHEKFRNTAQAFK